MCEEGREGVISCSIAGPDAPVQAYADAAADLYPEGIILVCASGNDGRRDGIDAPANTPGAVSVGAHDYAGFAAGFANRSPTGPSPTSGPAG